MVDPHGADDGLGGASPPVSAHDSAPEAHLARIARHVVEAVSVALFATMFAAFVLQIVFRYVLNAPLIWSLELCLLSFLWLTFWNCGFLLRLRDHIGFTMIYDAVAPARRRVLALIGMTVLAVTFAAALPGIIDWTAFMGIDGTDVFDLRLDLVFSIFPVFMLAVTIRALLAIRRLLGSDWARWI